MINKILSLKPINNREKTEILTIKLIKDGRDGKSKSKKTYGAAKADCEK